MFRVSCLNAGIVEFIFTHKKKIWNKSKYTSPSIALNIHILCISFCKCALSQIHLDFHLCMNEWNVMQSSGFLCSQWSYVFLHKKTKFFPSISIRVEFQNFAMACGKYICWKFHQSTNEMLLHVLIGSGVKTISFPAKT